MFWRGWRVRADDISCSINDVSADVPTNMFNPDYPTLGPTVPISCSQLQSGYFPTENFDQSLPQTISSSRVSNDSFNSGQLQDNTGIAFEWLDHRSSPTVLNSDLSLEFGAGGSQFNDRAVFLGPLTTKTDSPPLAVHAALETVFCDFPGCGRAFKGRKKLKYDFFILITETSR
jgi:hypothetical protein